jgi:hypothetical protein
MSKQRANQRKSSEITSSRVFGGKWCEQQALMWWLIRPGRPNGANWQALIVTPLTQLSSLVILCWFLFYVFLSMSFILAPSHYTSCYIPAHSKVQIGSWPRSIYMLLIHSWNSEPKTRFWKVSQWRNKREFWVPSLNETRFILFRRPRLFTLHQGSISADLGRRWETRQSTMCPGPQRKIVFF